MGKEIASLYATLGVDDKGLKDGLSNAKTGISKVSDGFKQLTGISLGSASALAIVGKSLQAAYKYMKDAVDQTVSYNTAIIENAKIIGMTSEEYSRFSQVADDVFISQEKLNTMMMAAARQGTDVTLPGIMKLSEQYNALGTVQEKAAFTAKNFGRAGLEMNKILELSPEKIKSLMGAVSSNLVVTEASAKKTIEYKQSVDRLQDSMKGLKYEVGAGVTPVLSDYNVILAHMIEQIGNADIKHKKLAATIVTGFGPTITGWISDYADKLRQEAIPAIGEHKKFIEDDAESLVTLRNAQDELNTVTEDGTQFFKDLTLEMIYNKAATILDADGALILGRNLGLINEATYNTMTAIGQLTEKYDTNGDGVIDLKEKTNAYLLELYGIYGVQQLLTDKTVTYTINVVRNGSLNNQDILPPTSNQGSSSNSSGKPPKGSTGVYDAATGKWQYLDSDGSYSYHASGGSFMMPSGVGYEGARIGGNSISGGEMVSVSNTKQIGDIMSGLAEATRLLKNLPAAMQRSVRDGMLQGA